MNVLMICGIFAEENQSEIIKNTKGYVEFSANIFQKKLIKGFEQNNIDIEVISAPFIGSYPNRYRKMFFRGFESKKNDYRYVNFCNVWGYRNFSRAAALKKEIKKIILKENNKFDLILVYSAHEPFLEAALYAKRLLPNSKICFVVPDLPQYMNLDSNKTKAYDFFKKFDIWRMDTLIKGIDSFVILTEPMKDVLHIGNRPYMVLEGIVDELSTRKKSAVEKNSSEVKNIVYTGKLNMKFGIKELVDSFMELNGGNYRLILCGDGDAKGYIFEKAETDSRIIYKGQVTPETAKEIIEQASVLVNPRPNDSDYTKYSFPSKNIEYLMSGNPVVAYILDGMPKVYSEFIYNIESGEKINQAMTRALTHNNSEKYETFLKYANEHLLAKQIIANIIKL